MEELLNYGKRLQRCLQLLEIDRNSESSSKYILVQDLLDVVVVELWHQALFGPSLFIRYPNTKRS